MNTAVIEGTKPLGGYIILALRAPGVREGRDALVARSPSGEFGIIGLLLVGRFGFAEGARLLDRHAQDEALYERYAAILGTEARLIHDLQTVHYLGQQTADEIADGLGSGTWTIGGFATERLQE